MKITKQGLDFKASCTEGDNCTKCSRCGIRIGGKHGGNVYRSKDKLIPVWHHNQSSAWYPIMHLEETITDIRCKDCFEEERTGVRKEYFRILAENAHEYKSWFKKGPNVW